MYYYRTQGFHGYAVKYSPYFDNIFACAASANFGLVGNGRLYVLGLAQDGIKAEKWFDTKDGLFDVAWNESHENQLAVASGDGSIKLFDIMVKDLPVNMWAEHQREVFAVHWNLVEKSTFCSSSWDGTVKIWSPKSKTSLLTLATNSCTYSAAFSPHNTHLVSCVSSDSFLRIFDLRLPQSAPVPPNAAPLSVLPPARPAIEVHVPGNNELLTHDWNRYRPEMIATGGVDRVIRVFDIRSVTTNAPTTATTGGLPLNAGMGPELGGAKPVSEFRGHQHAIRKLAWSAHWGGVLISAGYDMSVRVWEDTRIGKGMGIGMAGLGGRLVGVFDKHTEFVVGLDWSLFGDTRWAASAGWDEGIWVWDSKQIAQGMGMR